MNVPGGVPPMRPDQALQPISRAGSGPAPQSNVIVARVVIIVGAGGELLVYNPTAAAGNLVDSIAGMAGTDSFGNTIDQGITNYNPASAPQSGVTVQLNNGQITFGDPLAADAATVNAGMGRFHLAGHLSTPITFINGATDDVADTNPAIWFGGIPQGGTGRTAISAFAGGSQVNPATVFNIIDTLTFGSLVGGLPGIGGPSINRGSANTMVVATGTTASLTTALMEILGAIALKNATAPASVAGFAEPFATAGHLDYVAGVAGDTNTYNTGRLSLITSATTLINNTTLITIAGLSFNVAAAKYRVHGMIRLTAAASGTVQPFTIQVNGTATVSTMLLQLTQWNAEGGPTPQLGVITALATDPNHIIGTLANNNVYTVVVDGSVTFSAAGTFFFGARGTLAAGDETATAQTGNFVDLMPVS